MCIFNLGSLNDVATGLSVDNQFGIHSQFGIRERFFCPSILPTIGMHSETRSGRNLMILYIVCSAL